MMWKFSGFYACAARIIVASAAALLLLAAAPAARADCTSPSVSAGTVIYNADDKVMQYCDGANWVAMSRPGTGSGGCSNPPGADGAIFYNKDHRVPQSCLGSVWKAWGPVGGKGGADWSAPADGPALNNPTPGASDNFGQTVAISGNIAVVGAVLDESDGGAGVQDAGRAYVLNANTGALITALDNPSPNNTDEFGISVAIDGNIAVVGAFRDESDGGTGVSNAGRAYVFNATTGALITALDNPSPNANDYFGQSVAISGNIAVVGVKYDESDGGTGVQDAGRAYVFNASTGALITALDNPSPDTNDYFGISVAVSGNIAVVGAPYDESDGGGSGIYSGRAYVFNATTGALITALDNPSPNANDYFGQSVAISDNIAVVGAAYDKSNGSSGVNSAGRAYVFDATTGALITALNNPSPNVGDSLGYSIAVSGNIAVVGALFDKSGGGSGEVSYSSYEERNPHHFF